MTPIEMAKLVRTYFYTSVDDKEMVNLLLGNLLMVMQNHSEVLDDESLLQIFLTLHITRFGTREMYTTVDYLISIRLPEIIKDSKMTNKIYFTALKSGLMSQSIMLQLARHVTT